MELWRHFEKTPYELRIAFENITEDEAAMLLDYSRYSCERKSKQSGKT